jgi:hypothetical protein
MVKFILNDYEDRIAEKILVCSECKKEIQKGETYKKHSSKDKYHRLHYFCYIELGMKSIGNILKQSGVKIDL